MTRTLIPRRMSTVVVLAVGGGAVSAATWLGGQHGLAVGLALFYLACMAITYVWAGRDGDVAAILRASGDERQRGLDLRASALAAVGMGVFCLGGCVVDLVRGGSGYPWAAVCAVGGVSYVAGLAVLRRRG